MVVIFDRHCQVAFLAKCVDVQLSILLILSITECYGLEAVHDKL